MSRCNVLKRGRTRGVTLVEVMMVLGVAAILLGLVMTIFGSVQTSRAVAAFKEEIIEVNDVTNQLTTGTTGFNDINTNAVVKSGVFSSRYISGQHITTPFGGFLTIDNFGDTAQTVSIWVYNIPREDCVRIVTTDFTGIATAMNTNWLIDSGGYAYTSRQAASACQKGDSNYIGMNLIKR